MSVDAALPALAKPIESGQPWPRPACPVCQSGYIRFARPTNDEAFESASARNHPGFEPEWVSGTFTIRGQCENPTCQQAVHGTGNYNVAFSEKTLPDDDLDSLGPPYSEYYTLSDLHPPILMMPIPQSAPEEVREGVLRASRVFLADPGLAATALRATVERFLTTQRFPGKRPTTAGFYTTDDRIRDWMAAEPTRKPVAHLLLAVKWLGNAGTHEDSSLTAAEVLAGARALDEAFHRLFTGPDIDAYAEVINKNRGPSRHI